MPLYAYKAIEPATGRNVSSTIEGESEQVVAAKLREQSLHVTEIKVTKAVSKKSIGKGKLKPKSLVLFSRQFATMIDAGIPILRCLEILQGQCKDPVLKEAIEVVTVDVKSGITLNEALTKHPQVFNKLYVNMIKAAELGGILDVILDRLAGFLEYEAEVKGKIKSAMTYPVLVLVASQVMLFAMFTFVLPKFKEIFSGMNVEMPFITRTLFAMGDFMQAYWLLIVAAGGVGFVAFKKWAKTDAGRYRVDYWKLRLPIVGELTLKMSVARFARTFGTLLNSGVPMIRSLEIVGETLGNDVLCKAVEGTRSSLREGNKLSVPLTACNLFPTLVTTMIDVGEETGRLPEMLVKVGDFYDMEVESAVKGLTSLIEPLLIMFLGGVVGFIAISIMVPMFGIVNQIK